MEQSDEGGCCLNVLYDHNFITFVDYNGYEDRNKSMILLIKSAWDLYVNNKNKIPQKFFNLYTDDVFNEYVQFSFAINSEKDLDKCMPSFIFDKWIHCGILDYQDTINQIIANSHLNYEDERVFWIGSLKHITSLNNARMIGYRFSQSHQDLINFVTIDWNREGTKEYYKHTPNYTPLTDNYKHRVLIDFGGQGYSGRIPFLLATGRPVILVGHPHEAWYYWDGTLIPWVHYIPCGQKDGSNLTEEDIFNSIKWTFDNPKISEEIGKNGQNYAKENLNRNAILKKIGEILVNYEQR